MRRYCGTCHHTLMLTTLWWDRGSPGTRESSESSCRERARGTQMRFTQTACKGWWWQVRLRPGARKSRLSCTMRRAQGAFAIELATLDVSPFQAVHPRRSSAAAGKEQGRSCRYAPAPAVSQPVAQQRKGRQQRCRRQRGREQKGREQRGREQRGKQKAGRRRKCLTSW